MRRELLLVLVACVGGCGLINAIEGSDSDVEDCFDTCVDGRVCTSNDECRLAVLEISCGSAGSCDEFEVCANLTAGAFCVDRFDDDLGCPNGSTTVQTIGGETVEVCFDAISTSTCIDGFCG